MQRRHADRLPHALLLTGPRGLGKHHFALTLAHALLCQTPMSDGQACRQCRACLLYLAGNHPDCLRIEPEEEGKIIKIDALRAITDYLALTSHYEGYRIVIISPAEQMNLAASNCLLKTLEEPVGNVVLILVASVAARLLPTLRSRCQVVDFVCPDQDLARTWLAGQLETPRDAEQLLVIAQGCPLLARQLHAEDALTLRIKLFDDVEKLTKDQADAVALAAAWHPRGTQLLTWLLSWTDDMIRLKLTVKPPYLINRDLQSRLQHLGECFNVARLYFQRDKINEALRLTGGQINPQMQLENILLSWVAAVKK